MKPLKILPILAALALPITGIGCNDAKNDKPKVVRTESKPKPPCCQHKN